MNLVNLLPEKAARSKDNSIAGRHVAEMVTQGPAPSWEPSTWRSLHLSPEARQRPLHPQRACGHLRSLLTSCPLTGRCSEDVRGC